jgi:hypothetical protein
MIAEGRWITSPAAMRSMVLFGRGRIGRDDMVWFGSSGFSNVAYFPLSPSACAIHASMFFCLARSLCAL